MKRPRDQAGFALVLVLGALVIAGVVAQALLSIARDQTTAGRVALDRLAVEAEVEGAIERAIFALLDDDVRTGLAPGGEGAADGAAPADGVALRVSDVCGRWDLNIGDPAILARLVRSVDPDRADAVVAAVEAARLSGDGFVSVEQLRALPPVDTKLAASLLPEVTVDCRASAIDPDFASARLLAAAPAEARQPGPRQVFEIRASAARGPGTRVEIAAVVAFTFEPGRAWRVVSWRQGG
jgi:type II secretory pathway component PulK